jgi:hypothetical protein
MGPGSEFKIQIALVTHEFFIARSFSLLVPGPVGESDFTHASTSIGSCGGDVITLAWLLATATKKESHPGHPADLIADQVCMSLSLEHVN